MSSASEAFALAQTNKTANAATSRAALSAERDRRRQLAQLQETVVAP